MEEQGESKTTNGWRAYIDFGAVKLSHKPQPRKVSRPHSGLPIAECDGRCAHAWSSAPGQQLAQANDRMSKVSGVGKERLATMFECSGEHGICQID
jgi:hypothetical protein